MYTSVRCLSVFRRFSPRLGITAQVYTQFQSIMMCALLPGPFGWQIPDGTATVVALCGILSLTMLVTTPQADSTSGCCLAI